MFTPYKGRTVKLGQKVKVYRNLHKEGVVYSIMDAKTKLVLGHASILALRSCTFKVSQKGRERVIREQRKNVHAWIIGHYDEWCTDDDETMGVFVEYNPYKHEMFQRVWDEKPIQWSDYVLINGRNILAGY